MPILDGYCKTDNDGLYYREDDTYWGIWPDHETGEPGYLIPKIGAEPVSREEATGLAESEPDDSVIYAPLGAEFFLKNLETEMAKIPLPKMRFYE